MADTNFQTKRRNVSTHVFLNLKNRLDFLCLPEFQYHHTLCLLLLRVNYIQLQRKSKNFHGLRIKTKRILGLILVQIQAHIYMTCACHFAYLLFIVTLGYLFICIFIIKKKRFTNKSESQD